VSTTRDATAQIPLEQLIPPGRPRPMGSLEKVGQPVEAPHTNQPLLQPTDRAGGPIAYYGPDRLKTELTKLANDSIADIAQGWCDVPIEIPITPLHVTLLARGSSGQATATFAGGKMSAATVVANANQEKMTEVIKHEMTHIVLHARCGLNLPRWFNEGCASLSEGEETLNKFRRDLVQNYLVNNRGISFQALFMRSDPPTGDQIWPFYAEATTLIKFLRDRAPGETVREKQHYLVRFICDVIRDGASMEAYQLHVRSYFGFPRVSALQQAWLESIVADQAGHQ